MNKGISTWLFTKMVMLVFLTMTFAIIMSFTGLVQQRSLSEAAQQIAFETTDGIQSLLGIKAEKGFRFIIIPDEIPRESENSIQYTVDIYKPEGDTLGVAIARGKHEKEVPPGKYITGTSFKLPEDYDLTISGGDEPDQILLTSEDYNFIIVEMEGKDFTVYGCEEYTAEDCL